MCAPAVGTIDTSGISMIEEVKKNMDRRFMKVKTKASLSTLLNQNVQLLTIDVWCIAICVIDNSVFLLISSC